MNQHAAEIASGKRFTFGDNWTAFLAMLDGRIARFVDKLTCTMLSSAILDNIIIGAMSLQPIDIRMVQGRGGS
jgi:hypothetical protein